MASGHRDDGQLRPDKANHPGRKVSGRPGGPVATGPYAGTARDLRAGGGTRLPIPSAKVRRYPAEPYNWESRGQS